MTLYLLLKTLHTLLAAVLFGAALAGVCLAWRASHSREPQVVEVLFSNLIRLEVWLIAPAALLLPLGGLVLAKVAGWPLDQRWLLWSVGLYVLAGLCWLPLLWLQVRIRNQARRAFHDGALLAPETVGQLALRLKLSGLALVILLAIFALMVVKPL